MPDLSLYLGGVPLLSFVAVLAAAAIVVFGGISFVKDRERQSLFTAALGIYLLYLQWPVLLPLFDPSVGASCPLGSDFLSRFGRLFPAVVLLALSLWPGSSSASASGDAVERLPE